MSLKKSILLVIIILLIDQISKIYIKTHFTLHESVEVFSWFKIYFIENEGMAWGTRISDIIPNISDRTAKTCLTLFRVVAIFGIGYWLFSATKKRSSKILICAIALIFAGALGNIIDSVFYGVLFDDSLNQIASFLPEEGGYDTLLHGKVVDMLYFPMYKGYLPEWIPKYGGKFFTFFEPVFNIADMAISTGFIMLIVFNKRAFAKRD
ncbi:lipoprotein signal peptidase [Hyunsoonleella pacifica]|uniref:Lipoprotein signal peptidase n=1 Tax=Hyunsoonleella pacifica TaxID=1080224 RepID=A0A4Q9FNL9_9FLAO|nr:lipoprotein signal peptidase [Hyunsoonleella pacifica]TBN16386.1 lipoprotein signal peptidase [Hyunsoonleella pacifica]GGD19851.1 lipoprotein signal peptidase [Hyunsoonleella pacifica]